MNDIAYKLKRTLSGKMRVAHECPACHEKIENDLSEAGESDACPACGGILTVPGQLKREQVERKALQAAEKTAEAKAAKAANVGKTSRIAAELDSLADAFTEEAKVEQPAPAKQIKVATLNDVAGEIRELRNAFADWRESRRQSGVLFIFAGIGVGLFISPAAGSVMFCYGVINLLGG